MQKKKCSKCKENLNLNRFSPDKRKKDGKASSCKSCYKLVRDSRKDKQKEYMKNYYKENKSKMNKTSKLFRETNPDYVSNYNENYRKENIEIIKDKKKVYYQKNKKQIQKKRKDKINNSSFLIKKEKIRNCIRMSFKRKGYTKKSKTYNILGEDYEKVITHLIQEFEKKYQVKWNELFLEKLDIDHIIPITTAKDEKDLIKLNKYTNLQFLYYKDNRYNKKDHLDYEIDIDSSEFYLDFKDILDEK